MHIHLGIADLAIIACYFALVLGVGYFLKGKMRTSADFLLSKRNFSHWVTGIAFMSANLGALEVMGHVANGAKYGMRTNNWYWVGAIPAMVFLGLSWCASISPMESAACRNTCACASITAPTCSTR